LSTNSIAAILLIASQLQGRRCTIAVSRFPVMKALAHRPRAIWPALRIAPDESISLQFEVKRRGPVVDLAARKTDFQYDDWFPKEPNVGYETLIYDVIRAVTSVRP